MTATDNQFTTVVSALLQQLLDESEYSTQQDLAVAVGMTDSMVSRALRGKSKVGALTLARFEGGFGLPYGSLTHTAMQVIDLMEPARRCADVRD